VEIVNAQKLVVVDGETVELTHGSERVLVRFAPAPALQCPRATSPTARIGRRIHGAATERRRRFCRCSGAFCGLAQYNDRTHCSPIIIEESEPPGPVITMPNPKRPEPEAQG